MDIRNNLSTTTHFSPYQAYPAPTGGEGDADAALPPPPPGVGRFPSAGDSLMPMGYGGDAFHRVHDKPNPEKRLKRWRIIYVVSASTCAVSSVVFILLASQPVLVVFFTLGRCVIGHCDEWLEFSSEVFKASLVPLAVALATGTLWCTAYVMRRRLTQKSLQHSEQ